MSNIKYKFSFSDEDIRLINEAFNASPYSSKQNLRARVLLALEESTRTPMTSAEIAGKCETTVTTVQNIRTRLAKQGLSSALYYHTSPKPPITPVITAETEDKVIALAQSAPPNGKARWTIRSLAEECVRRQYVKSISPATVMRFLKKHNISLQ